MTQKNKAERCVCEEVYDGLGIVLNQKCPVHGNNKKKTLNPNNTLTGGGGIMSENKTLEEEIREIIYAYETDDAIKQILSLVVARIPKEKIAYKTLAIEGGKEWVSGYNQHYADCIQAIREK